MTKKIVQTAGRDNLGDFAPLFAHLNDDILFGEVWNDETIDLKTRAIYYCRFINGNRCHR